MVQDAKWIFLPDLGRGDGCMGIDNVLAKSDETGKGATLEYEVDLVPDRLPLVFSHKDIYPLVVFG